MPNLVVQKLIFLTLALCMYFELSYSIVAGVDFGGEFFKVALVKPGSPFEIVTNIHSKRKTETMVAFDGEERFYGADALNIGVRRPHSAFCHIRRLLGNSPNHPQVVSLTQNEYYPYEIIHNATRGSTLIKHKEDKHFSSEELVAMVFSHARDITNAYANAKVSDWVITVPSFFAQSQRQALLDAADITGVKVLSLIDENTAAALQFGIDRKFEHPYRVMFFNMGSTSLQVSVAEYSTITVPDGFKSNKTVSSFKILAKAWNDNLGGNNFDLRLASYLAEKANKVMNGVDIRTIPRVIAKIKAQAKKTKIVLSANEEIPVVMPGLYKDIDFQAYVTRKEFEEMSSDLFDAIPKVVMKCLENGGLKLEDIDAIELIGGSVRIPKVSSVVRELFNGQSLGRHLNGDEAMALGAAFYAANISTAFRVRTVGMTDISPFPISLRLNELNREAEDDSDPSTVSKLWHKKASLFKMNNPFDSRKSVTFKHNKDLSSILRYDDVNKYHAPGTPAHIATYNITGVEAFVEKMKEKNLGDPQITLTFHLDSSGIVHVVSAEASLEEQLPVEEVKKEDVKEEAKEGENASKNVEVTPKLKTHSVRLTIVKTSLNHEAGLSIVPMTIQDKKESISMLRELQYLDEMRAEKEQAKNSLESYVYSSRDKLSSNEEEIALVSTKEQLDVLTKEINDVEEWLEGEGENSDAAEYRRRLRGMSEKLDSIFFRLEESKERPKAIAKAERYFRTARSTIEGWKEEKPHITKEEVDLLLISIEGVEKWLESKKQEQSLLDNHVTPVLLSRDIKQQLKSLRERVNSLSNRPRPPAPEPVPVPNNTTMETNTTSVPETTQKETVPEKDETVNTQNANERPIDSHDDL